jgi:Zn-dependent M28 family amino/carboxypeptidase
MNVDLLDETASYIFEHFDAYGDTSFYQEYKVNDLNYRNVVCRIKGKDPRKIIIGAHYDVCGMQEGADDNASGIVGLLELARLFEENQPAYTIELVAYTLEEPPYFRTEQMGSFVHAQSVLGEIDNIYGMISLEMIGYFSDEKRSQQYPLRFLRIFYGNKGNFITLVNKLRKGPFARSFSKKYKKNCPLTTKKFNGFRALPGVDFSDHLNYWNAGISALMLTDTAFYRNKNYHLQGDSMEKLSLPKMAQVIDGLYQTLLIL